MKKLISLALSLLFFFGFALCNLNQVNAKTNYLSFNDDGIATLGRYPQTMVDEDAVIIKTEGNYNSTTGWYEYKNKEYAILKAEIDTDYEDNEYFNNGQPAKNYKNIEMAFLVEDIEWEILSYGDGYVDIIPTRVLDRQVFDNSGKINYLESSIYKFNNNTFINAFTNDEMKYLKNLGKEDEYYVSLPSESEAKDFKDDKYENPSDYAIASRLSCNRTYDHAPYWTKTISYEGDRIKVQWSKSTTTNCLVSDNKIGVRPVIRVDYKGANSGGSSSSSSSTSSSSSEDVNVALIIGITFSILGASGLIAFFVLWAKKHPSGKPPLWIIITVFGSLLITIIGMSCFAGGISSGSSGGLKYGYYVQSDALYSDSSQNMVQAGYTGWLIRSDGTCAYDGSFDDKNNASDFKEMLKGTYTISGSKIKLTVGGPYGGTYTYTVKNGKYLYYNGKEAYHWVRGE